MVFRSTEVKQLPSSQESLGSSGKQPQYQVAMFWRRCVAKMKVRGEETNDAEQKGTNTDWQSWINFKWWWNIKTNIRKRWRNAKRSKLILYFFRRWSCCSLILISFSIRFYTYQNIFATKHSYFTATFCVMWFKKQITNKVRRKHTFVLPAVERIFPPKIFLLQKQKNHKHRVW